MIDIVASALTFEHWANTQQQEQGHRLCRSSSTSSTHSTDSDTNTRIYRNKGLTKVTKQYVATLIQTIDLILRSRCLYGGDGVCLVICLVKHHKH